MNSAEQVISRILTNDAYERYKRILTYHKQKAAKIDSILLNLYQSGRIKSQITDEEFIKIVQSADDKKEEGNIRIDRRKRDFDLDDL